MSDRGPRRPAVWRRHDFAVLWAGQTVSEVGSQVTTLALPTLAIFSLHAGPAAVGLLVACGRLPFPVLSLFAGAVVDRLRKRRLMIVCDVARLLILAVIPALAATGHLTLGALFAAAIAMGVFTVFFDIAYLAYVPILVDREHCSRRTAASRRASPPPACSDRASAACSRRRSAPPAPCSPTRGRSWCRR